MKHLLFAFFLSWSCMVLPVTAQTDDPAAELRAKAVSTVAADQPGASSLQKPAPKSVEPEEEEADAMTAALDSDVQATMAEAKAGADEEIVVEETTDESFRKSLKRKFIEGNAGFMSLVALALVLGLAFCIERIIYLTLSEINTRRFLADLDAKIQAGDIEGATALCRDTRGPVASICCQGLLRIDERVDVIERAVTSYGSVQAALLEKGCSWITLCIAVAPSLGFLGTVIGMVMAFDQIQNAGDISPTIVAAGMKVALITTIFGIIVALILQLFYNFILTKIENLTAEMEDAGITLLDAIVKHKARSAR